MRQPCLLRSSLLLLLLPALACTRPNPAFDSVESGTDTTGKDTLTGDGDPGDGDGDPGDGDGDPGDGDGAPGDGDGAPGDGDGEPGDGDGDPIDCGEDMLCGDVCVNIDTDPQHCGGCDEPCPAEQLCSTGECAPTKTIFVTGAVFTGGVGIEFAHSSCNTIASLAGRAGIYKAWISNGQEWPDVSFVKEPAVYVRTDGEIVAYSFDDLTDGTLVNPINRTEAGLMRLPSLACEGAVEHAVWTGTDPSGQPAFPNCNGWGVSAEQATGLVGNATATDMTWTASECHASCDLLLPFYCVEQ